MSARFMCSLCCKGILGGGLYLDSTSVTYRTNKLTVDKELRKLVMPISEISEITWKRVIFPVADFHMKDGKIYKFIIFNKSRFVKKYNEVSREN